MKENVVFVLVDLFSLRKDFCGGFGFDENDSLCIKFLSGNIYVVVM